MMLPGRVVAKPDFVQALTDAIEAPDTRFFADTSFLLALVGLNENAQAEVREWLTALGDRLGIPAWVAHEVFGKIKDTHPGLTPMAVHASSLVTALNDIQNEARRFVTDEVASTYNPRRIEGLRDRITFLAELDREIGDLRARALHLKAGSKRRTESVAASLIDLIEPRVIASDIYADLRDVDAIHAARLVGNLPPGNADKKKETNKYGDLIIWLEIVRACKGHEAGAVVLLTNDVKPDWAFRPSQVLNGAGVQDASNDGISVIYPQPSLVHELRQSIPGSSLSLVGLQTLANLLHRQVGGSFSNLFAAYESAAPSPEPVHPEGPPLRGQQQRRDPDPEPVTHDVADILPIANLVRTGSPQEATEAVGALQTALEFDHPVEALRTAGRALAEASAQGLEPASIAIRGIARRDVRIRDRSRLMESIITATYFETGGAIRNRPLASVVDDVFAVQDEPELAGALRDLRARLHPVRSRFLLLPNPNNERVSVEVVANSGTGREQLVAALYRGERPLTIDMLPGAPGTIAQIIGRDTMTIEELRPLMSDHFSVPGNLITFNLTRTERVRFDELTGLVPWGTQGPFILN